jgi:hypothetical protein
VLLANLRLEYVVRAKINRPLSFGGSAGHFDSFGGPWFLVVAAKVVVATEVL